MRFVAVIVICVAGLTGCISAVPPSLEVVGAELTQESPQGARVEVAVVMSNPNDVAIQLPEASYTLSVADAGSYAYVEIPARVLGPKGVQAIRLPAAIQTDGQALSGKSWEINGSVTYSPENYLRSFLTETGIPLPLVLFSGKGVLE
ncbi:hypothetical protein [Algisphaera agarilytica]|uniref:LEA14-like dessication related protein n=1 Tax=Algisphaera agarilytica TaxID=1385975 RepID=A0A7X0H999_9BACT|nr:hypothetical protein [Algisphaera agarilytica]MBB6431644.1 hypothetical protein [Algisphaera agarilytica]